MTAPIRPQGPRRRSRRNSDLSGFLDEAAKNYQSQPDATRVRPVRPDPQVPMQYGGTIKKIMKLKKFKRAKVVKRGKQ